MPNDMPDTLRTTSMWGATIALARGAKLLDILPPEGRFTRAAFLLSNEDGVALKALDEYWNADPLISFRAMMNARNQIFDLLRHREREALTEVAQGA
jgi:hypothetical protein